MGRQIVDPRSAVDRLSVVEALSKRLVRAVGDWRKHGEGAERHLALALWAALGPQTLHAVFHHLNSRDPAALTNGDHQHEPPAHSPPDAAHSSGAG